MKPTHVILSASALSLAAALVTAPAAAQEETPAAGTTVLDRIVISAGKEKVAIDTPQAVTVVDQEDIENEQPTTVGDVLTDIPGVKAVGSDRVLGESFNIRGFGTLSSSDEYRLIVTVDGAQKFHEQYRLGSLFTDPELYKRVEVLRGPASSTLYGSGALAGVINLTTKDASDYLREGEDFTFREKLQFNDNRGGFLTSSVVAAEPVKNLELLGSFIYRRSDDFKDGNGDIIPSSAFDAPSGLVKASYRFGADESHRIKASYQHWTTESDGENFSQTDSTAGFGTIDRTVVDQTAIVGYAYTPDNPYIDLDTTLSYTNSQVEQRNTSRTSTSDLYADADYAYEIWTASGRNSMEWSGDNFSNVFISGLEFAYQTRTADNLRDADGRVTFHPGGESKRIGIFAQNEWVYRDRLTLIPGIRVDHQTLEPGSSVAVATSDVSHTGVSPKLAAHYKLTDNWGIFGSVSYTERMPVLDEIYDANSSNLNLDPEKSLNYEGGVSVSFRDVAVQKDAITAKATVFLNQVEDLIDRASSSSTYYNVGESEIKGIELESSYNATYTFARAAFTMIRGEDKTDGSSLNSIPADELVLTLGGRVPSENIEFGWRGVFADEQHRVSGTTDQTGGYVVHDVFASWKPQDGYLEGAEIRFGIDNLLDKQYREHLSDDAAKGRTFKLTLAKQF